MTISYQDLGKEHGETGLDGWSPNRHLRKLQKQNRIRDNTFQWNHQKGRHINIIIQNYFINETYFISMDAMNFMSSS